MAGAAPFPFESLSRSSGRAAGEDCAGDGTVARRRAADDHWTALSPFGPNSEEQGKPEQRYTADELAHAVDEARRMVAVEVEARLRSEWEDSLEKRRCDLLTAITDQLALQRSTFDDKLAEMALITQSLAVAMAKAVVPRAIEREPLADIADALKVTLARLVAEPSVELRLPPDLVETEMAVLEAIAQEAGFDGDMVTTADPTLGNGDAMVCWKGGLADRRLDRLQAEALDLVDRWLPAPARITGIDDGSPLPSSEPASEMPGAMAEQTDSEDL